MEGARPTKVTAEEVLILDNSTPLAACDSGVSGARLV